MIRLHPWQWAVLALPFVVVVGFLGIAAGQQIHQWHLNWIWAVMLLIFVGWRMLLVRWLRPVPSIPVDASFKDLSQAFHLPDVPSAATPSAERQQAEAEVQRILALTQGDDPPWENWSLFFQRGQQLVEAIAAIYAPQVKRPLLNVSVPQAYRLLRGTVDDVDQWMQTLTPLLGQVTIGQAVEAYEAYQRLEPSARMALKAWNWAQWVFNPLVALARVATQESRTQVNQQLILNLGQLLREATLKALGERAIALYSGDPPQPLVSPESLLDNDGQTQTLRELLAQASPQEAVAQRPLQILLLGRTGAGKSSLVNTLFQTALAAADVLPSTDHLQSYTLTTEAGETLQIWDTPGYAQVDSQIQTQAVLAKAAEADLIVLVTPATDAALQMDLDILRLIHAQSSQRPILTVVTHVDRLRPLREWEPPYDWQNGDRPKEQNIRAAVQYRQESLAPLSAIVLPLVTAEPTQNRSPWGHGELSQALLTQLEPAKQSRLGQFLQDRETRLQAAAQLIQRYSLQMNTTQGLTALLKSPLLRWLSQRLTGSPALAIVLTERLPLEQSAVVVGKLQLMAELHALLSPTQNSLAADLLKLWPLVLEGSSFPAQDAWALGYTLIEYWSQGSSSEGRDWRDRYQFYRTTESISGQSQAPQTA